MNYLSQIQRGVDYIEGHLEQPIAISAVARGAFPAHVQGLTGDTAKDYIRSRRLARAGSRDELIADMEDVHRQVPGGHFVTTSFAAHHQKSIANWDMKTGDGATIGTGVSYGEYDGEGKLLGMHGFFEARA